MRTMRVDLGTHGTQPADKSTTERARSTPASAERGSDTLDKASFSFDHTRVKALESQVLAQPEVRQQRVESLRQSLGKGEYAVADGQVAEALFADLVNGSAAQLAG